MNVVDLAEPTNSPSSVPPESSPFNRLWTWCGIGLVTVGLIAAGIIALNRSTQGSASMTPAVSSPCETSSTSSQRDLVLNPPAHLPESIGACVLQYARVALRPPELGPVTVTSAKHTGYAPKPIDPKSVEVTTWDGTQGLMTVAGKTLMYVQAHELNTLDGQHYGAFGLASEIFLGVNDSLQQKSLGFSHVAWTKASSGNVTWILTAAPRGSTSDTPAQVYTVSFDRLGRPTSANACQTQCTSSSVGTFETYAPLRGKVTVPAEYWAASALREERQAAGAIANSISQQLRGGTNWTTAVSLAAATPFAQWAPGPAAVSHDTGTAVSLSADKSRITLYSAQRLYTFNVWRVGRSAAVQHSPLRAIASPTTAQLQIASDTVAAQITDLTRQLKERNGFIQAVIEAFAGQTAMGMTTAPASVYAQSLHIIDGNTIHITLVEAGHHFGFTIRQDADGTVAASTVRPTD